MNVDTKFQKYLQILILYEKYKRYYADVESLK